MLKIIILILFLIPTIALAHPSANHQFSSVDDFLHFIMSLDHLLLGLFSIVVLIFLVSAYRAFIIKTK